jgi:hypothetical protein
MQKSSWGGWVVMGYQVQSENPKQVNGEAGATMAGTLAILPGHYSPVAWFSARALAGHEPR